MKLAIIFVFAVLACCSKASPSPQNDNRYTISDFNYELRMPNIKMPRMPVIRMPQMPDIKMPQMPDIKMPQMPDIKMPQMTDIRMPQMPVIRMPKMPEIKMPHIPTAEEMKNMKPVDGGVVSGMYSSVRTYKDKNGQTVVERHTIINENGNMREIVEQI